MLIFLDIDGVMVPAKSWKSPELLSDGFPSFSLKAVNVLRSLISEATTIMLTTSHKSRFTAGEWKDIFEKRGLSIVNIKSLKYNVNGLNRREEILNWFHLNYTNENFLIIDDDKSLNDLPSFFKDRLILTSSLIGLNESHIGEIESILNKKK
ncbi:MAG: HAD domain-containing protein [Bacteroidetes bacterium]|nr:HAD domain-containing protein [Bacteroidota bacterium]